MATNEIDIKVVVDQEGAARLFNQLGEEIQKTKAATDSAGDGFTRAEAKLVTLNAAVELGKTAASLLASAFKSIPDAINRGSEVDDITQSFQNLAEQAGTSGDAILSKLNTALSNTIPNFDLMRQSNELLIGGLAPDDIEAVAIAARALGEATGVSAAEGMEKLSDGLLRGNDRALKQLGIIVDVTAVEERYADQLGKTREQLTENERAFAVREESLKRLKEETGRLGQVTDDAGDRLAQLSTAVSNAKDQFFAAIATNKELNEALAALVELVQGIDFTPLINDITTVIELFTSAANTAISMRDAFQDAINPSGAQIRELGRLADTAAAAHKVVGDLFRDLGNAQTKQDIQALTSRITEARAAIDKMGQSEAASGLLKQLGDASKIAFERMEQLPEATKKTTTTLTNFVKSNKDGKKAIDDIAKSTDDYSSKLRKLLGHDALPGVSEELQDVFYELKQGNITTEVAEQKITDLGRAYMASSTGINTFTGALSDAEQAAQNEIDEIIKLQTEIDKLSKLENPIQALFTGDSGEGGGASSFFQDIFGDNAGLAEGISNTLGTAITDGIRNGFDREDIGTTLSAVGKDFANEFGLSFLNPFIDLGGDFLNDAIESIFGGEHAGTTARKAADKFFADAFDANRLQVIIDGQLKEISDLVFKGDTLFGEGNFESGTFDDFLSGLPVAAQQAFGGVGLAFEEFLGVSEDISGQIAGVLANNIGGSLNNLQLLVGATGKSFEELRGYVVEAFLDGKISALEAQSALNGLAQVAQKGIPDGIGFTVKAFENLKAAGEKGGRASIDALQDIGFEAKELGIRTFPELVANLAASGEFTAAEIQQVFDALAAHGIDSIEGLTSATEGQLIPVLAQLQATEFPFAEAINDASDLANTLDRIPDSKTLTFNIKTNLDSNTQKAIDNRLIPDVSAASTAGNSVSIQ